VSGVIRVLTSVRLAACLLELLSTPPVVTDVEMPSTARSGRRSPQRTAALVAGSVVTVFASALLPSTRIAGAATLAGDRAQAAQISAKLQADSSRLDALAQQYELAQQQVSTVEGQISQARAAISQDQAEVAADESQLRGDALKAYETGASDSGLGAVFGTTGEQAAVASEYTQLADNSVTDAIDSLQQAEARLNAQQAQLQASDAQAQAELDRAGAARSAAAAAAASEQGTLRSLNGQITQLLAQQNAKPANLAFGNPPPSGAGGAAVRAAESQIGVPYQWGAEDPGHGFDCSGLTQWSWGQAGVDIPRTADAQMQAVARVPLSAMEPGDLVFWGSGGYAEHVAIYVGNGEVVDAPSSGQDVQIQPIWSNGLLGAGRP
jgi:cell wall-associated NlpC family hydrolase